MSSTGAGETAFSGTECVASGWVGIIIGAASGFGAAVSYFSWSSSGVSCFSTGSLAGSEDLVYASQEWLSKKYIDDAASWGVIDPERWDAFYSWLYKNDLTTKDLSGQGYSNDYLPQ